MKKFTVALVLAFISFGALAAGINEGGTNTPQKALSKCGLGGNQILTKGEAIKCGMSEQEWVAFSEQQIREIWNGELKNFG